MDSNKTNPRLGIFFVVVFLVMGEIPDDLFGKISGTPASYMFNSAFSGCVGLTGESAKINGKYLYEIWPDETAVLMYRGCKNLTDYADMPAVWK